MESNIKAITITGEVATGKSTIAEALLEKLEGWRKANMGQKFRNICEERGWSIQKVSLLPDEVHREVDQWQKSLAETEPNIIIEGRLAGWLTKDMPHVLRVYCDAPIDIRVDRYIQRENKSREEAKSEIMFREDKDVQKYQQAYDLPDYRNPEFYSLIIDTSNKSPQEIADIIIRGANLMPRLGW